MRTIRRRMLVGGFCAEAASTYSRAVIDLLLELEAWLGWLAFLIWVVGGVLLASYFGGRALPIRLAVAIFGVGTAVLAVLAYRLVQSQVEYCRDSPEVAAGGDRFSCLEPGNWFALNLAFAFFALVELGLVVMLAFGLFEWNKRRRAHTRVFREASQ
jgi:hypothetical protein